jgi:hypothetical protein
LFGSLEFAINSLAPNWLPARRHALVLKSS